MPSSFTNLQKCKYFLFSLQIVVWLDFSISYRLEETKALKIFIHLGLPRLYFWECV
jgi:hypothetical protein